MQWNCPKCGHGPLGVGRGVEACARCGHVPPQGAD